jgi:hypothetical protein
MRSDIMRHIVQTIETRVEWQPRPIEFEMAYQARVAVERIKFAIRHTEQFAPQTDPMREVGLQLLDALQRLESVDRSFQEPRGFLQDHRTRTASARMPLGMATERSLIRGSWVWRTLH